MQQLMLDTLVAARVRHDRQRIMMPVVAAVIGTRSPIPKRSISRVRGGGSVAAVGKLYRRPACDRSIPRRSTPAREGHCDGALGHTARSSNGTAAYRSSRTPSHMSLFARGQGQDGGCAPVALGYISASGAPDAADAGIRASSTRRRQYDRPARPRSTTLVNSDDDAGKREAALDIFYNRYAGNSLVHRQMVFQTQALVEPRGDTRCDRWRHWRGHP